MSKTLNEAESLAVPSTELRSPRKTCSLHLALIYLALLSVTVLWWTKPPLRNLHQLRFSRNTSLIDVRYLDLLRVLPPDPKLGYISDLASANVWVVDDRLLGDVTLSKSLELSFQAQYALAPRILEHGTRPRYIVA